jgi:hypothetical protein
MVIRAYGAALTARALEVDLLCTGDKRGATPGGPQPHGDALKIDAPLRCLLPHASGGYRWKSRRYP